MNINLCFSGKVSIEDRIKYENELREKHDEVMASVTNALLDEGIDEVIENWGICAKTLGMIVDTYNSITIGGMPCEVVGFVSGRKDLVIKNPNYDKFASFKPLDYSDEDYLDDFMASFSLVLEVKNGTSSVNTEES
jgi:hypothetical protein